MHKFNDWIEALGAEKILIRHTSNVKDGVGLQKMEKKDEQFLIEELIYNIEKKHPYTIETEKNPINFT